MIYQKDGVYAKITDFYKSIGTAQEIGTKKWDGMADISQVDLDRFATAEKQAAESKQTKAEESDSSIVQSIAPSNASSTQVIRLLILFIPP